MLGMLGKKLFVLFIFAVFMFSLATNASASMNFVDYYKGNPIHTDLSNGNITNTSDEKPEIIEKLENAEKNINAIEEKTKRDIGESVWEVIVARQEADGYKQRRVQVSYGSCWAVSPFDPKFKMDEFDKDLMANMEVAKKRFEKEGISYFLTNYHVVRNYKDLPINIAKIVRDGNGRSKTIKYEAEIVAVAPREDPALIMVKGLRVPTLALGDLNEATEHQKKYGYPVVAIGSPYGIEGKRAEVKAYYPAIDNINTLYYRHFGVLADLSLDTVRYLIGGHINPGNSGGPSIGLSGSNKNKVIGINNSGYRGSDINFAIPCFTIARVVPQLFANKVHYPVFTGLIVCSPENIKSNTISDAFLGSLGLKEVYYKIISKDTKGVVVVGFVDNSPFKPINTPYYNAEKKTRDIIYGDIIASINGEAVADPYDFLEKIRAVKSEYIEIGITRWVKKIVNEAEIWEEENINIKKLRKDLTLSDQKYKFMYQSMEAHKCMEVQSEIGGKTVNIKIDMELY